MRLHEIRFDLQRPLVGSYCLFQLALILQRIAKIAVVCLHLGVDRDGATNQVNGLGEISRSGSSTIQGIEQDMYRRWWIFIPPRRLPP